MSHNCNSWHPYTPNFLAFISQCSYSSRNTICTALCQARPHWLSSWVSDDSWTPLLLAFATKITDSCCVVCVSMPSPRNHLSLLFHGSLLASCTGTRPTISSSSWSNSFLSSFLSSFLPSLLFMTDVGLLSYFSPAAGYVSFHSIITVDSLSFCCLLTALVPCVNVPYFSTTCLRRAITAKMMIRVHCWSHTSTHRNIVNVSLSPKPTTLIFISLSEKVVASWIQPSNFLSNNVSSSIVSPFIATNSYFSKSSKPSNSTSHVWTSCRSPPEVLQSPYHPLRPSTPTHQPLSRTFHVRNLVAFFVFFIVHSCPQSQVFPQIIFFIFRTIPTSKEQSSSP